VEKLLTIGAPVFLPAGMPALRQPRILPPGMVALRMVALRMVALGQRRIFVPYWLLTNR
jgi:hypothetical protein